MNTVYKFLRNISRIFAVAVFVGALVTNSVFAACTNPTSTQHTGFDGNCHECKVCDYKVDATYLDCYYTEAQIECGNGSITCGNYGFLVTQNANPELSNWDSYGAYQCLPCPNVRNGSSFGFSNKASARLLNVTWSTTERCVATTNFEQTAANGCKYKVKIRPDTNSSGCEYVYSTEQLPDLLDLDVNTYTASDGCNWEDVGHTYTYAPAGYGISGTNGTTSVTCGPCGDGYYSPAGSVNCIPLPKNSNKNSDGSGFDCVAGTYKSGSSCVGCPIESFNGPATLWGSSAAGSTSVTGCYTPGTATGNKGSDDTGDYEYTSNCYWGNVPATVSYFYWSSSANATACSSAINEYCGTYLGITNGYEFGSCAEAHKTTNPLAIDTIGLQALFGYIYGSCGGTGFNVSIGQGSN